MTAAAKTVLITGANGQMGTLLGSVLMSRGYKVLGISSSWGSRESVGQIDLANSTEVRELIVRERPCAIFHLAAVQGPSGSLGNLSEQKTKETHLVQNGFLMAIAKAVTVLSERPKIVVAGSSKIFSSSQSGKLVDWQSEIKPSSEYAFSKHEALLLVRNLRENFGLDAVYGLVFNNDSNLRGEGFLLREITQQIGKISSGTVFGSVSVDNANALLDWSAAEDFSKAYANILESRWSKDFILASSTETSVREIVEIAADLTKKKISLNSARLEPPPSVISSQNDLANLGVFSKTPVHKVLSDMLSQAQGLSPSPEILSAELQKGMKKIQLRKQ